MITRNDRDSERESALDPERKAELAAELAGDRNPERQRAKLQKNSGEEREFTLNTPSLFGLFLALVLLCGIFFGFGFTMGRRSSSAPAVPAEQASKAAPGSPAPQSGPVDDAFSTSQSSPTPPVDAPQDAPAANQASPDGTAPTSAAPDSAASGSAPSSQAAPSQSASGQTMPAPTITLPVAETPLERRMEGTAQRASRPRIKRVSNPPASSAATPNSQSKSSVPTAAAASQAAPPAGSGGIMVQVAAVARSKDANLLASALRQQGYPAVVRTEPYDKFLHVQIGPFSTRQQADAMRHKLIANGYNAIVK